MDTESLVLSLAGAIGIILGLLQTLQNIMQRGDNKRQEMFDKIEALTLKNQRLDLCCDELKDDIKRYRRLLRSYKRSGDKLDKKNKLLIDFLKKEGYNIEDILK